MKKCNIIFALSAADIALSKRLFGTVVRVIVTNGCTSSLDQSTADSKLYCFPENSLSLAEIQTFIEQTCAQRPTTNLVILTNNMTIATSVPKVLCRIAKKRGEVLALEPPLQETFCAPVQTFLLEADCVALPTTAYNFFKRLIDQVNAGHWQTDPFEKEAIMRDIELCGDEVIYYSLYKQLGIDKRR